MEGALGAHDDREENRGRLKADHRARELASPRLRLRSRVLPCDEERIGARLPHQCRALLELAPYVCPVVLEISLVGLRMLEDLEITILANTS